MQEQREQMNVVIVGHVDHGKSTLIGRLLADTDSLPKGKLESVKANCERNAKPFEYAFLLDALKDEQAQGITIDTARSFFKSKKRDYIIIDAPGHIEFLKNMITGAARAEAALLVIDAKEGIRENSKRHGYMMSFLGIRNITVCVNKMDLVGYGEATFEQIKRDYTKFLQQINISVTNFIPIAAMKGDNMVSNSSNMPWYKGPSVLEALDQFVKAPPKHEKSFRMPIQDIYKFTEAGDDRRIFAGRVETGTVLVGDDIIFLPSNKKSRIATIEGFNLPQQKEAFSGQSTGVTLETQIYIRPGEVMCRSKDKLPTVSNKIRTNIFWMGKQPLIKGKTYKLKIATQHVPVIVSEIVQVLNASDLSAANKPHVDRHEVAECILETMKPVAFDPVADIPEIGRFVVVDNYEISGGGIILSAILNEETTLSEHIRKREFEWERSHIKPDNRATKYEHKSAFIVITGQIDTGKQRIAKGLEEALFEQGKNVYFLGISNRLALSAADATKDKILSKFEHIQQLGELAHIMTDAGLILITSITDIDDYELKTLKSLNRPNKTLVINVGENEFSEGQVDLLLKANEETPTAVQKIVELLIKEVVLDPEYFI